MNDMPATLNMSTGKAYYKNIVFQHTSLDNLLKGRNVYLIRYNNNNPQIIASGTITDTNLGLIHANSTITIDNKEHQSDFEYIQFHGDNQDIINKLEQDSRVQSNKLGGKRRSKTRRVKKTKRRRTNRRK